MKWRKEEGFDKILNDIRLHCHSIIQIFTIHGFPYIPFLREGRVTLTVLVHRFVILPTSLFQKPTSSLYLKKSEITNIFC